MRVHELAGKSHYGRLAPLDAPVTLNEGIGDSIKTKAKALGSRVGNGILAGLGSNKADGRLTARIMTDRMIAGWKKYMGAANIEQTRENLFKFLNHYYGGHLGDDTLRGIVGLPTNDPPNDPSNNSPNDDGPQGNLGLRGGGGGTPPPAPDAPPKTPERDERQTEMGLGPEDELAKKMAELKKMI